MKTFRYILCAFVATFVLAGCSEDSTYASGSKEDPNSEGVYFPSQDNAADRELDPADPTVLTFNVMRRKDASAITVPVVVEANQDAVFTVSPIAFAEGATEATFDVKFDAAEIGKTYTCNIRIEDPKYAQSYGDRATGISFSVTRVKWVPVLGEKGETKGKWRDDIISSVFALPGLFAEVDIQIEERDDRKGYYRIPNVYGPDMIGKLFNMNPSSVTANCKESMLYIDATDPNGVTMAAQELGCTLGSDGWISAQSNAPGLLENGIITFPKEGVDIGFSVTQAGSWIKVNRNSKLRIMLPGVVDYDYSLALSKGESVGGKIQIGAKLGANVAKVKYAFFEGALNEALATDNSDNIDKNVVESKELTATGTITAEFDKTGKYTIVANAYDAAGVLKGFEYTSFGYVAKDDEVPVVLSVGINVTDKYAPQGFTSENSLEIYAYGEEIESGYYGLFETLKIAPGADLAALVKKSGKAFNAEQIAEINKNGFSGVIGKLVSGTKYTLIVSGFNGYVTKVVTAKAETKGVAHPLDREYTMSDLLEQQPVKSGYIKTWNYYAVDEFAKPANPNRKKIGTVTLIDNTTDDIVDEVDPNKNTDFLDITGMSGLPMPSFASKTDKMLIEYFDGLLATYGAQPLGLFAGQYYLKSMMSTSSDNSIYPVDWALLGGVVEEGYVAFVANPDYIAQGVTFNGIFFDAYSDAAMTKRLGGLQRLANLMFVDPATDTANPKPSAAPAAVSHQTLHQIAKEAANPRNFVEMRDKARLNAIVKEYVGKPRAAAVGSFKAVEMPGLGVAAAKTSFERGAVPAASMSTTGAKALNLRANVAGE